MLKQSSIEFLKDTITRLNTVSQYRMITFQLLDPQFDKNMLIFLEIY